MQDLKNAYTILGVREGATKDEIMKKYRLILRKYEQKTEDGKPVLLDKSTLDEISKAYDLLMGYHLEEAKKKNPVLKKVENFIYYHKVHVLVGIFIAICLAVTLSYILGKVNYDLKVAFIGDYYPQEMTLMEDAIKKDIKGIKQPQVTIIPSVKIDPTLKAGYRIRETAQISSGDLDVLVLDKDKFDLYVKSGVLLNLDDIISESGIDKNSSMLISATSDNENKQHIYGIDVKNNKMVQDTKIQGQTFIAAICVKNNHNDNAIKLINLLLK